MNRVIVAVLLCIGALWLLWAPSKTYSWSGGQGWVKTRHGALGYRTDEHCTAIAGSWRLVDGKVTNPPVYPEPRTSTDADQLALTIALSVVVVFITSLVVLFSIRRRPEVEPAVPSNA